MPRLKTAHAAPLLLTGAAAVVLLHLSTSPSNGQAGQPGITVSDAVPSDLNPQGGGAANATPAQAAAFAWQSFIALNWPAGPQEGRPGQRDTPSRTSFFGDPAHRGPLVWETFRHKYEIFPGRGIPPGFPGTQGDRSFGYDALPQYNYSTAISACDPAQADGPTPWINLDETTEIGVDTTNAGVVEAASSPGNSAPQLIRYLAKANRAEYVYVAENSVGASATPWWKGAPNASREATRTYIQSHRASPPPGTVVNGVPLVSLPFGTIEIKSAWRPLNPAERESGRFHVQRVRFYEPSRTMQSGQNIPCYRDADWGLVALHIIQKTPSAPYFIFATFEQADNLLTADGRRVEDTAGNVVVSPIPSEASTPQTCLLDPRPPQSSPAAGFPPAPSALGNIVLATDPATCQPALTSAYCDDPGSRLYIRNLSLNSPSGGKICVNRRELSFPDYVVEANRTAHAAIQAYLNGKGVPSAPWLNYKLNNIQYVPHDKVIGTPTPNGSLYSSQPPYTARNPAAASYYQANIVVETNRSLQRFSGALAPTNVATDWNADGSPVKNVYHGGHAFNMGGCMGCHGAGAQRAGSDFSFILQGPFTLHPTAAFPYLPDVP